MSTKKMWKNLDQDGSGAIDEREFNESLREYYDSDPNQKTFNVASNNSKVQILYDPYNTAKSDLIHRKQIGGGSDDAQKPGSRGGGRQHDKQRSSRDPLHALLSNSRTSLTNATYGQFSEHSKHWDMHRAELAAKTRPHTVASPGRRSSRGSRRSKGSSGDSFFERGSTRPASSTGTARSALSDASAGTSDCSVVRRRGDHDTNYRWNDGSWNEKPLFPTQGKMLHARAKAMLPHKSFDIDGDGAVSSNDFFLASKFDINNDGKLDTDERTLLRKSMVNTLMKKYNSVPKADDPERREFFKKYTKNLDDLVSKDSFMMDFNKLYQKTACAMAFDSAQVFGCVQPDAMKAHERKQRKSTADGDESTRTATSLSDTATAFKASYSRNSGMNSRDCLLKTRQSAYKTLAVAQLEADSKRYPAPGACWQNELITGPAKIGHHKKGHW